METNKNRKLFIIANEIIWDWNKVNFAAKPYLTAMLQLNDINDMYYNDTAKTVILYFLSNASTWRGETAKRIKKELNLMCK